MAKDSFAQSIGAEWVQLSILTGVIVFINSVAAAPASSPTALSTRHVSQGGMQIGAAFSRHQNVVSASIVFKRDVKRLVDVSDPVSEKFQRCELLRLARIAGRQDFEVLPDRRQDARRCNWAGLGVKPIRVSRQVQEMLA